MDLKDVPSIKELPENSAVVVYDKQKKQYYQIDGKKLGGEAGETGAATTELYCFAMRKLYAGATRAGAITRASDSGSIDVPFTADGDINTATVDSFLNGTTGVWGVLENQTGGVDFINPTAETRPGYAAQSFLDNPSLAFTGRNFLYDNTATAGALGDYTFLMVFKPEVVTGTRTIFISRQDDNNELQIAWRSDKGDVAVKRDGTWIYSGVKATPAPFVLSFIAKEGSASIRLNGATIVNEIPFAAMQLWDGMRLGENFSGTDESAQGYLSEFRVWSGAMAAGELEKHEASAAEYYGVNLTLDLPVKQTPSTGDYVVIKDSATGLPAKALVSTLPSSGGGSVDLDGVTTALTYENIDGATGDGTTTGDNVYFQNALNAMVAAGGGEAFIHEGDFVCSARILDATNTIENVGFSFHGNAVMKHSGTQRVWQLGASTYPASTTTAQIVNFTFDGINTLGKGAISGNDANAIDDGDNITQFIAADNFNVFGGHSTDVGNGQFRFNSTSEGNLFERIGTDVPTRVSDTVFTVPGDRTSDYLAILNGSDSKIIGIFNGEATNVNALEAAGDITGAVYNAGNDNTEVTLDFSRVLRTAIAAIPSGTITQVGKLRTEAAFDGLVRIIGHTFRNVKQCLTTNDTGHRGVITAFNRYEDSGNNKYTTKVLDNSQHIKIGEQWKNCAQNLLVQGTTENFISVAQQHYGGHGTNATPYGAVTISHNSGEDILRGDNQGLIFDNYTCHGDYKCLYIFSDDTRVTANAIFNNWSFLDVTATRGGVYSALLTLYGRLSNLVFNNITCRGIGGNVDIIRYRPTTSNADTYADNIVFSNIVADGGRYGLYLDGSGQERTPVVHIKNCHFKNIKNLYFDNVELHMEGCTFEFADYDNTAVSKWLLKNSTFKNCVFKGTATGSAAFEIIEPVAGTDDVTFDNVTVIAPGTNDRAFNCTNAGVTGIKIYNSKLLGGAYGIVFTSSGGDITIERTTMQGSVRDLNTNANIASIARDNNVYVNDNYNVVDSQSADVRNFTWNPNELAAGATESIIVSLPAAEPSLTAIDVIQPYTIADGSEDTQNFTVTAQPIRSGVVRVTVRNEQATALNLSASTAWAVKARKII